MHEKEKSTMCYSSDLNNPRKLSLIMGLCFLKLLVDEFLEQKKKLLVDEFLETEHDIGTAQSN